MHSRIWVIRFFCSLLPCPPLFSQASVESKNLKTMIFPKALFLVECKVAVENYTSYYIEYIIMETCVYRYKLAYLFARNSTAADTIILVSAQKLDKWMEQIKAQPDRKLRRNWPELKVWAQTLESCTGLLCLSTSCFYIQLPMTG